MKRLIREVPQKILAKLEIEWLINIYPKEDVIESSTSIMDTGSNEYHNFIDTLVSMFSKAGFELYRDPRYTHVSNTPGSQSDYYTFLQIQDYILIEVIVHVRVSDHPLKNKPWGTASQRRQKYLDDISEELADEYELSQIPYSIPVDIVFGEDDKYLKSYPAAIRYARDQILAIQDDIDEWRADNPPQTLK